MKCTQPCQFQSAVILTVDIKNKCQFDEPENQILWE